MPTPRMHPSHHHSSYTQSGDKIINEIHALGGGLEQIKLGRLAFLYLDTATGTHKSIDLQDLAWASLNGNLVHPTIVSNYYL